MSYITGNKLIYHMDRVMGDQRPITAELFLTNFCNHRCSYCRFHHGRGYIDIDHFKRYAERLVELGVKGFILTGGGEPTLNPDFTKITEYLEENHLEYGINTNFNKLRLFKPRYLKVSIDASSPEEYQEFRKVRAEVFHKVRENIKKYREWQEKEGHDTTLGIQSLVYEHHHVLKFYEAHKDLPVDYMVFRPLESRHYNYGEEAKKIIDEVVRIAEFDPRVTLNYKWHMLTKTFESCFASWSVITVRWDGMVQYCCHKPHEIVGHILDPDILDKKRNFKTDMKTCERPCRLSGNNAFLENLGSGEHHAFV